jgi:uncharacterized membrane protein YphA (DoxX/SURF4 family)
MKQFFSSAAGYQNEGLALVRIITGFFMAYHGWEVLDYEKMHSYLQWDQFKSSSATFMIYAGKTAELMGGIFLMFGLFTKIAALVIVLTMFYISIFIGNGKIWYEDQHPFLFVLLGVVFFFIGGGKWSLDHLFFDSNKYPNLNNPNI